MCSKSYSIHSNSLETIGLSRIPQKSRSLHMNLEYITSFDATAISHWTHSVSMGLADAAVCPDFGQPGWGPFCFLNGNPLFKAFDSYQSFVQESIVSLHDLLVVCSKCNHH